MEVAGKVAVSLAAAFAAALAFALEGAAFAVWAVERQPACAGSSESCALDTALAPLLGSVPAFEAFVAALVAVPLALSGRRVDAGWVAGAFVAVLALEHLWLVLP